MLPWCNPASHPWDRSKAGRPACRPRRTASRFFHPGLCLRSVGLCRRLLEFRQHSPDRTERLLSILLRRNRANEVNEISYDLNLVGFIDRRMSDNAEMAWCQL